MLTGLPISESPPTKADLNHSKGLTPAQAEWAVKKFRSHRRIGESIFMDATMLVNPS